MTRVSKCFRSSKTTTALHPSNTFTTLLSLFNDTQSDAKRIHEFCSRFEGNLSVLSHSLVTIPQILQVMLFLRAIHPCYEGLLNQFASKQKDLSTASIDLILSDAKYRLGVACSLLMLKAFFDFAIKITLQALAFQPNRRHHSMQREKLH